MWPIFQVQSWVDNHWNTLIIGTQSAIDTTISVHSSVYEKIYLDVFIYSNGSNVYPEESSFIFFQRM